jgi:hypothetical protein
MIIGVEENLNVRPVAVEELDKGELGVRGPDLEGVAQLTPHHLPAQLLGGRLGRESPQRPRQVRVGPSLSWIQIKHFIIRLKVRLL